MRLSQNLTVTVSNTYDVCNFIRMDGKSNILWRICRIKELLSHGNIEIRSRDYATVDEAVFSPCLVEPSCRAVTSRASPRIASPRLLPGNSYKHLDDARVGRGHVTASAMTHVFQQWPKNWRTVGRSVFRLSDQGFIGETEARLQGDLGGDSSGRFAVEQDMSVWIEDFKCEWKTFFVCNIWSDLKR
jgi:hypothetical protein